jgi:formylglycine-generating enzyme required for sulfatase activity
MVYIPGGIFTMGAPKSEESSDDGERPQHLVVIPPFCIGKYPITQVQWLLVANLPKIEIDLNPNPSHFKGNNRPVENISWYDTVEFCARLSKKTGRSYRLPSEAEWEYACRAGTETPFYFGSTITTNQANYDGNYTYGNSPQGQYREQTTDVGSFPTNAFGLYDLHGNVWEWCADPLHDNYNGAPGDGRAWDEKDNDNRYQNYLSLGKKVKNDDRPRVLRGGSWYNEPWCCRSAVRGWFNPGDRGSSDGFRAVCSVG